MEFVFLFLMLAALLALVVGLIKPALVTPWSAEPSRGRVLLIYGIALIASFILFGVFAPQPTPEELAAAERREQAERQEEAKERAHERALELAEAEREAEAAQESNTAEVENEESSVDEGVAPVPAPERDEIAPPDESFDGITNQRFMAIRREMRGDMTDLQFSNLQQNLIDQRVQLRGRVQEVSEDGSILIDMDRSGMTVSDVQLYGVPIDIGSELSRRQWLEFEGTVLDVQKLGPSLMFDIQATSIQR